MRNLVLGLALGLGLAVPTASVALDLGSADLEVREMVAGFDAPWAMGFLPGGGVVVTERGGTLWHLDGDDNRKSVAGLPDIAVGGQGGLLDVLVPADFARSRELLLSFSIPQPGGAGTGVMAGRLSADNRRLEDVRTLFESAPGFSGGRHFGSRLIEAPDGTIFVTMGDRGDRPSAQDRSVHNGSVLRINRDGTVPADNPFVGQGGIQPEIWSYGHRNPQGAALDLQGQLWVNEHGARGGDEVNRIVAGANYGWPVISYGRHYSGAKIGEGTAKAGMQQPAFFWDPSIAPSGMAIYSGKLWPDMAGDVFVGSLKFGMIARLDGDTMAEVARIEGPQTDRVRDVREAPDGTLWFMSVGNGALYRIAPRGFSG